MVALELEDDDETGDTLKDRYLTFRLDQEDYGIDIAFVTEIVGLQRITAVPDMPAYFRGVINLRGLVIPIMDVRLRFGMPPLAATDRTCIIVVNIDGTGMGLVVDSVQEVLTIPAADVSPPPKVHKGAAHGFVRGLGRVGEEVKVILNSNELVSHEDLAVVAATQETVTKQEPVQASQLSG